MHIQVVSVFYAVGVAVLLCLALYFILQTRIRRHRQKLAEVETPFVHDLQKQLAESLILRESGSMIANYKSNLSAELDYHLISEASMSESRVAELGMDINLGVLEATRGQEKKLSKAKAEELLSVLRDELSIAPKNLTSTEIIQAIRARLISLTEMMSEAQVSLCDLEHRVIDMDSIVKQLPAIVRDHRRHISTLHRSIDELKMKSATKTELQNLQKELDVVKWAITAVLGIILMLLGVLLKKAL